MHDSNQRGTSAFETVTNVSPFENAVNTRLTRHELVAFKSNIGGSNFMRKVSK